MKEERLVEFLCAFLWEGNVMRVAPNRAVVMVTGDREERPPARAEPPEAAAGGLRSPEVRHPGGWRLLELDGNRAPLEAESLGKLDVLQRPCRNAHCYA